MNSIRRWAPLFWRVAAALFLTLSGCAHSQPACRTSCGVTVIEVDCAVAKRAEARAVLYLGASVKGWTPGVVCEALDGWTVKVHKRVQGDNLCSATSWRWATDSYLCVKGFTEAEAKIIWVLDGDLTGNAYTHEVIHVVDLAVSGKAGHCGWVDRGAVQGIYLATEESDVPAEERDCPRRKK